MDKSQARRDKQPTYRVASSTLRPSKICVVLQSTDKDGSYTSNNAIFEHLNVERSHVRVNSKQFPLEEFVCDFTDKVNAYQRVYQAFLDAGFKTYDENSGSQVSYTDFKNLYPIYCTDVSKHGENLFETRGICDIEIRLHLRTNPTSDYYIHVLVVQERYADLEGISGRMRIIL